MIATILTLVLVANTPAEMPKADARVTVIRAERVRNVHGGEIRPAVRVIVECSREESCYYYDVPGRRWYWSEKDRGTVRRIIHRDKVPQKVRYAVLSLIEE